MKKKALLIATILIAGISSAAAQGGRVINAPYFDISQRILFSQNDYVYGTSRSAAMGGAFTSLGANLSSININPAGLGMYQSSDWGITQSLSINSMKTTSPRMGSGSFNSGGSRTSYGLDNVGMVFNSFNKSGSLTSLSFGFSYNRMANFNSRSYVQTYGEKISIADMFTDQLVNMINNSGGNLSASDYETSRRPFNNEIIPLDGWGSVLGYQSGLVTRNGNVFSPATGNSDADSYMQSITKGGIYDYAFSLGANINNILYLGATLGASQVHYKETLSYEEYYTNGGTLDEMWYDQHTSISGVGFTMKLGAVLRPVSPLRIGVAFHLPTYYNLDKSYSGEMYAARQAGTGTFEDELRFNTAPRLLTGISYVIADRAILAVDYECAWYNKIRLRSDRVQDEEDSKAESQDYLNPVHSIRAGFEFLISDAVSLRLGGGYQSNMLKDKDLYDAGTEYIWFGQTPTAYSSYNLSGGLGFNIGRNAYVDVTYMYKRSNYAEYDYYYLGLDNNDFIGQYNTIGNTTYPREYFQKKNQHAVSLTIGSRF